MAFSGLLRSQRTLLKSFRDMAPQQLGFDLRMRRTIQLTALLVLGLNTTTPAQRSVDFKVGTWKLESLGAEGDFRDGLPNRDDRDLALLGRKVRELGVAALAVQEVYDEATLRKVAAAAGPAWECVLGTTGEWGNKRTAQRIGFLWDTAEVELLGCEELLQLPREYESKPIFQRVPVTGCFRHIGTRADFRLVTVHLKAGRRTDDETKRRGESLLLAQWLDDLQRSPSEDRDVVLLGAFNSSYLSQPQQALEASGRRRWLTQPRPTSMGFEAPFDHIVVADGCVEVERGSLTVDDGFDDMAPEAWRKTYSNHFPITVTLRATVDDDDATFTLGPVQQRLPVSARAPAPTAAATPVTLSTQTPTPTATTPPIPTPPPAPAPAPGRQPPSDWAYVAGVRVTVQVASDRAFEGALTHDVPPDGQGWIRLQVDGEAQPRLIHCATVMSLRRL